MIAAPQRSRQLDVILAPLLLSDNTRRTTTRPTVRVAAAPPFLCLSKSRQTRISNTATTTAARSASRLTISFTFAIACGQAFAQAGKPLEIIASQDKLASAGVVKCDYRVREIAGTGGVHKTVAEVSFDADRVTEKLINSGATDQPVIWQDQGCELSLVKNAVTIDVIGPNSILRREPIAGPDSIGPQFSQGRGLTYCTDASVRQEGGKPVFHGKFKGFDVVAELLPNHAYVAVSVDLITPATGKLYRRYTCSDFQKAQNGLEFATKGQFITNALEVKFDYSGSTFGPANFELPKWFQQDYTIVDRRVTPPVSYSYAALLRLSDGKEPTLAEVLSYSQKHRGELDSKKESDVKVRSEIDDRRARDRALRIIVAAFVGFVIVGVAVVARRMLKS